MRFSIFAAALASYVVAAEPVSAHAFLKSASPQVGSTVHQAPAQVDIGFTESVEPHFSQIAVVNAGGQDMAAGPIKATDAQTHLVLPLKSLAAGVYKVSWRATATDTHKTQGRFVFTVAP
jgi:methionine-rich copper-binding protein CopC